MRMLYIPIICVVGLIAILIILFLPVRSKPKPPFDPMHERRRRILAKVLRKL